MKNFSLVSILFLFIFSSSVAQNNSNNDSINTIEKLLISNKLDSIPLLIKNLETTAYISTINKIYKNENPTYKDYYDFIFSISNRDEVNFEEVSDYINTNVKIPSDNKNINLDYVEIKWFQISKLRDEVTIEMASVEQAKLETYINEFDENVDDVIRSKVLISTHQVVLLNIQNKIEKGKILCLKNIEYAKNNNDTILHIIFLYHLCDFLILEGKLDEYINASEQSLELEKLLPNHSSYYIGNTNHLLDAYIYKGNNNKKIIEMLEMLYSDLETRKYSYPLYMKFIGTLGENSKIENEIYKKFEVSGLLSLSEKLESIAEGKLNANDFYYLIHEISITLESKGYLKEALNYKQKCIFLTRKIYTQNLSNSLASFKSKEVIKQKNIEINAEKERSVLSVIISFLTLFLFLISMFLLFRIRKHSNDLEHKNKLINKSLKEKELLVKEVHHRVKNNFQIVLSLLELQTKGIEDKKALALINEGRSKVKSMALIHQKLYQNDDGLVDFDEYIQLLIKEISSLYGSDIKVKTHVNSKNMYFDIDTAIPLGLIVNELITNTYKYAFKEGGVNTLTISISKEKEDFKLLVSDNGKGLSNNFDIKKTKSLGLRLVNRLVKQLHGTLLLTNNNGANFDILFKDIHSRKRID